jgi:hypothetical protein
MFKIVLRNKIYVSEQPSRDGYLVETQPSLPHNTIDRKLTEIYRNGFAGKSLVEWNSGRVVLETQHRSEFEFNTLRDFEN